MPLVYSTVDYLSIQYRDGNMRKPKTLAELNKRNRKFWEKHHQEFVALAENYPSDLTDAADLASRLISAGHVSDPVFVKETSLYTQLQKAKERRAKYNSVHAQRPRPDALQVEIEQIASRKPYITEKELLDALETIKGMGIIQDIDKEDIYFAEGEGGPEKCAPISGLRSRLSRVKKKIKSR
jgi:hypothetical protein